MEITVANSYVVSLILTGNFTGKTSFTPFNTLGGMNIFFTNEAEEQRN